MIKGPTGPEAAKKFYQGRPGPTGPHGGQTLAYGEHFEWTESLQSSYYQAWAEFKAFDRQGRCAGTICYNNLHQGWIWDGNTALTTSELREVLEKLEQLND